jgi:hypothetical protein
MNEQSDTPRTDEKYESICESWSNSVSDFPEMTEFARKLERELTAARAEIDMMGIRYAAAEMHHANNMQEVTAQRDRLAEALKHVAEGSSCCACRGSAELVSIAEAALQSLTTNEQSHRSLPGASDATKVDSE